MLDGLTFPWEEGNMSTPTRTREWIWPADVLAFAGERGLTPYLEPVLTLTRRIFPERMTETEMTADYEIPDERSSPSGWMSPALPSSNSALAASNGTPNCGTFVAAIESPAFFWAWKESDERPRFSAAGPFTGDRAIRGGLAVGRWSGLLCSLSRCP